MFVAALAACANNDDASATRKPIVMASALPTGMVPQLNIAATTGLERYERIVRNVEDCPLEGYQVVPTCPGMQMFNSGIASVSADLKAAVGRDMIGSASPAVRVTAAELMQGASGLSTDSQDAIAEAAGRERDPGVLRAFIRVVADHGATNPRVAAVLLAAADHADKDVRLQAVYALTSATNRGLAGGATKLVALAERDSDQKVRHAACEYGGKLGANELLPLYEKLTANTNDPDLYAACMEGLVRMFHNHPVLDTANEQAYRLFLRRLDHKPRTEHSPPWNVMSTFCYFSHESDLDKLAAWKQQAPWFDPTEVKRVMASVIADKSASWMARAAAVESMVGLGATKGELEALKRGYHATDRKDKPVLEKIAGAMRQ
jgi:hypothetical protein